MVFIFSPAYLETNSTWGYCSFLGQWWNECVCADLHFASVTLAEQSMKVELRFLGVVIKATKNSLSSIELVLEVWYQYVGVDIRMVKWWHTDGWIEIEDISFQQH